MILRRRDITKGPKEKMPFVRLCKTSRDRLLRLDCNARWADSRHICKFSVKNNKKEVATNSLNQASRLRKFGVVALLECAAGYHQTVASW